MFGKGRVPLRIPWVALFLIATGIGGWVYARPFPGESKALPQAVSLAIALLATFVAFSEALGPRRQRGEPGGGDEAPSSVPVARTQRVVALALVIGFAVGTYLLGVFASSALLLALGMRLLGSRWRETAWITGATMLVLYLLFVKLLGAPIRWGLIS